jgi:carbonic anhydrase
MTISKNPYRLNQLFAQNEQWVQSMTAQDQDFFHRLADTQTPDYLWIGCSDARVPANQITGLAPGEVFVHRNIANVVVPDDLNVLSVIDFAIAHLKVKHIIVVGHYGCAGVRAALKATSLGLIDQWIGHIRDVQQKHADYLGSLAGEQDRFDRLCELNVIEQVVHVCQTESVQQAWARGQALTVHGWVYGVHDGLARDLGISLANAPELDSRYAFVMADRYTT